MKKFASLSIMIIVVMACQNPKLEQRVTDLEKWSAIKDKQIGGLTSIAYTSLSLASGLDSTETLNFPKSFKTLTLTPKAICETECFRKYSVRMNICRHVSPKNREWCENQAEIFYDKCLDHCK